MDDVSTRRVDMKTFEFANFVIAGKIENYSLRFDCVQWGET